MEEEIANGENDIVKKTAEKFIVVLTNYYKLTTEGKWTDVKNKTMMRTLLHPRNQRLMLKIFSKVCLQYLNTMC